MIFVAIGWVATAAYLVAHAYLSANPNFRKRLYYGLNMIGAVGFIISSAAIQSWQSVVVNVFWAAVTIAALRNKQTMKAFPYSRWLLIGPAFIAALIGLAWCLADFGMGAAILGWAGTALYCLGYYLFASGSVKQWQFLVYNTIAAIILLPIYQLQDNWPAFALSAAWSVISLFGLWQVRGQRRI